MLYWHMWNIVHINDSGICYRVILTEVAKPAPFPYKTLALSASLCCHLDTPDIAGTHTQPCGIINPEYGRFPSNCDSNKLPLIISLQRETDIYIIWSERKIFRENVSLAYNTGRNFNIETL